MGIGGTGAAYSEISSGFFFFFFFFGFSFDDRSIQVSGILGQPSCLFSSMIPIQIVL